MTIGLTCITSLCILYVLYARQFSRTGSFACNFVHTEHRHASFFSHLITAFSDTFMPACYNITASDVHYFVTSVYVSSIPQFNGPYEPHKDSQDTQMCSFVDITKNHGLPRKRERERERESVCFIDIRPYIALFIGGSKEGEGGRERVCVCVRERERERELKLENFILQGL